MTSDHTAEMTKPRRQNIIFKVVKDCPMFLPASLRLLALRRTQRLRGVRGADLKKNKKIKK